MKARDSGQPVVQVGGVIGVKDTHVDLEARTPLRKTSRLLLLFPSFYKVCVFLVSGRADG